MKTRSCLWSLVGIALGFVIPNGQVHAQTPGCVVVEVIGEDQELFANKLAPVEHQEVSTHTVPRTVDKRGKEKTPKHLAQQVATEEPLVGSPPALPFGDRQHGSMGNDHAGTTSSTREKAFASGQSLSDYCKFSIETTKNR